MTIRSQSCSRLLLVVRLCPRRRLRFVCARRRLPLLFPASASFPGGGFSSLRFLIQESPRDWGGKMLRKPRFNLPTTTDAVADVQTGGNLVGTMERRTESLSVHP
ncbi:hypothetical protein PIB30_028428 [Stylosanthes scabra]|uniref:Secreted protein n=1 Tax=Stylosanthes scabra TaxID=79078 RepID=A0ABU6WD37_9FABA|nr:hypothetical protein [Stylosanthes scabra]